MRGAAHLDISNARRLGKRRPNRLGRASFPARLAIALIPLAIATEPTFAQSDAPSSQLEELKAGIDDLEARIDALMRASQDQGLTEARAEQIRGLVQDVLADADTRAGLLQSSATAGWDKGFFVRSADGNFELKLSGRLQLRYVYNHQSDPEDGDDHRAGFETRRVRLEFTGHVIDPRLTYAITASFARDGCALELLDAVVNYAFGHHWTAHIGRFRAPITRELEVLTKRQLAADRSPIDTAFPQDRFVGVGLDYEAERFRVISSFVDATPTLFEEQGWLGSVRGELIVWDNVAELSQTIYDDQLGGTGTISVTYTDLQQDSGVYSGTGNINEDPDFVDPSTGVYRLLSTSPCIDEADGDYVVDNHPDAFDLDQDDNGDPDEPTPDLVLNCRVVDDTTSPDGGGSGVYPFADMGAYEYQVDARADCPADIFPVAGNDWNVGEGDLGELLANWGSCSAPCPADLFPVGNPDGTVGAGDLGELIANWGMCATIQCQTDFGDSLMGGGGGGEGGGESGGFGEQDWPQVELTEELYHWLTSATLDEIIEWLWSLLEQ